MRSDAILALLLIALLGLAVAPQAAAAPPEPCNGAAGGGTTVGPATLWASPPCYQVDVKAMSCPLAGSWKSLHAGDVTVRYYTCDSPMSASAVPPVCIEREAAAGPLSAGFDSCRQDHETNTCSSGSPQRIHRYEQVGPAWAQVHQCLPHMPPPLALAGPEVPDPCGPTVNCQGPDCGGLSSSGSDPPGAVGVRRDVSSDCRIDVYVKVDVMDCLWSEGWNEGPAAGPVQVYTWGCRDFEADQAFMADPFPTCIRDCSPVPDQACGLQDATPSPLYHAVWGYDRDCRAEVSTSCLGGSSGSTDRRVAFVDVSLARCDTPDWS